MNVCNVCMYHGPGCFNSDCHRTSPAAYLELCKKIRIAPSHTENKPSTELGERKWKKLDCIDRITVVCIVVCVAAVIAGVVLQLFLDPTICTGLVIGGFLGLALVRAYHTYLRR